MADGRRAAISVKRWFAKGPKVPKLPRYTAVVVGHDAPKPTKVVSGVLADFRLEVPADTTLEVSRAAFSNVDLGRQTVYGILAVDSTFDNCDFQRLVIGGGTLGSLPQVTYRDCDFSGADFRGVSPLWARFERCRFDQTRLDDWYSVCAEFVDCIFVGRVLRVKFSGEPKGPGREKVLPFRQRNEFRGNDFRQADLSDCTFSNGIDLDANFWPDGDKYVIVRNAQQRLARAAERLDELPHDQARDRAVRVLRVLGLSHYQGQGDLPLQRDLLLQRDFLGPAAELLTRD